MISIILISFELNASVSFVRVALVAIVDFSSPLTLFNNQVTTYAMRERPHFAKLWGGTRR